MSGYLIREIDATPNVDVCYRVRVADGTGTSHLESLALEDTTQIVPLFMENLFNVPA